MKTRQAERRIEVQAVLDDARRLEKGLTRLLEELKELPCEDKTEMAFTRIWDARYRLRKAMGKLEGLQ